MNRGTAKQNAEGHGAGAALGDYDAAIRIMEALRQTLEPRGHWHSTLRNNLASAYMNRGNAKQDAEGHGAGAALGDYDAAIRIGEALRQTLEPRGQWDPPLRNNFANACMNRCEALLAAHDPEAACRDARAALGILDDLVSGRRGDVNPEWRQRRERAAKLLAQACAQ